MIDIPLAIIFLLFIFFRFKRKVFLFTMITMFVGVGLSLIRFDIKKETFIGIVVETKDNYFILNDGLERYYVSQYENTYEVGDILNIKAHKEKNDFVTLESEFDFNDYLEKKGVYYSLKNTNISLIFSNPLKLHTWRKDFLKKFDKDAAAMIGAILFSDNSYDSQVINDAQSLHLIRLISTSGVYIYFFLGTIEKLLSYRLKEKHARIISLIILFPYLIFTFPKFSVIKIIVLYIFRFLNDYVFKKKLSYLQLISLTGILFVFIDYHFVYQDAFILGFLIPLSTYFVRNQFSRRKRAIKTIYLYLSLFVIMIPFELKYYHEVSFISPFFHVMLSPLFIILSLLGIISFLKIPIYYFVNLYTSFIGNLLSTLKNFNPVLISPPMSHVLNIGYYLILIILFYFYDIGFHPLKRFSIIFLSMIMILHMSPISHYIKEEVYFVNVGQGDCTILRKGEISVMIDTGGNIKKDIAKNVLIPFLKKKQIYDLDLVITTHDDYDHMGALSSLRSNYLVRNYIKSADEFPIKIGKIEIQNYNYSQNADDENYSSLVMSFHLANRDFVIMGDAPIAIERQIINNYSSIPCDVLKVGHHGSNTSSCDEFIKYLSPKEAIISCGRNNTYGHPHESVLKILYHNNVIIKRTDILGTIAYYSFAL
ncbi:MAG: ComEC/Rec2 family competence protein [Bacilli bacterium]|nr:ComEC/Rec2 family competence protein [Bacilli bacterium]